MNPKLIVLVFAIVLMTGAAFLRRDVEAQSAPANQTGGPKPVSGQNPRQLYKNLQVLTELKSALWYDFVPNMELMSGALSVSCDYCHDTKGRYDADDKRPKLIARDMIKMMRAINENNFGGRPVVTCNTCHQGKTRPNGVPTPWYKTPEEIAAYNKSVQAAGQPEPPPVASSATLPDADQVMANYRKAVGAADAVKSIRISGAGSFATFVPPGPFEFSAILPDKFRLQAAFEVVINGERGWQNSPQGTIPLTPDQIAQNKDSIEVYLPVKYAKPDGPRKVTGIEHIGGSSYYVVQSQTGQKSQKLYFDVQSGLLYKVRYEIEAQLGVSVTETMFEDYRDVNGVRMPYRVSAHTMSNQILRQISELQINIDVDPAKFEPPPPPPERKSIKVDPKILDTYLGEYQLTPTTVLTFTREGDRFLLNQPTGPQMEVFAESETEFFLKAVPAQITFVKDDKGQVTHLVLHQPGRDREMKKVK